ncbi:hypothetical protein [Clostridium beijerinckii]|jgi:hypothetical protein|uniref:hypothetical protein n=1 Tax=Clostridium beijerinckii TaxID=1520 RepID=UPI001361A2CD|nr:hypothetical protein [Clostridium beijerinckii]MZK51885.1 hypothetical protein [Clostridium beijerinckii]MZK58502.1 hypothetical protein [Clostridium beijerinckii]MZK68850.1 hypothetical protein [Clostridium beijerinckii]MZK74221.1 hypothetical protein [Clostridium beijerinckii]MZK83922.1 hypothetical protein [Clostridium beijerinckii]
MKKVISILLCGFVLLGFIGCKSNTKEEVKTQTNENDNVEKIAAKDNQVINNISEGGIDNYFEVMNETINSYKDLSKEFKDNYKKYSKDELSNYHDRVVETKTKFGKAREQVGTYNTKFTKTCNTILESIQNLETATNNMITLNNGGTEENAINQYNHSVDNMKSIIEKQDTLKSEILDSAK